MNLEGIQTEPRRLADGPNRAQRRAKLSRNPKDGRDDAIKRGRAALRTKKPANGREHEARARK